MKSPPSIIDPFHRLLWNTLTADIDNRTEQLTSGSATNYEDYRYQVAFIHAFNLVLEKCAEIEKDRYGARPGADSD